MELPYSIPLAAPLSVEAKEYWVHLEAEGSLEKYPARQHARRVQEKLGIDRGLIYLAGQPAKNNEDSDMPAPFRQRRYFYYLTGCNEPSCHMTYDIQHDTLSLFIPRIDPKRVIWNGRGSTLAEAIERYDIDEVYYVDELGDVIKDWLCCFGGHGSRIFLLHNDQIPRIPGLRANIDSESLQPAMNAARMIKDEHEISLIRKANVISSEAHEKVLANILKFKNEAQVEGLFMDVCISHQAKQQAYDPIAASGPNAGTLHYDANNEDFDDRQLMCLDAGCEYELYASDITRTFPLADSWPSKEAENIYNLVERMQESCIERLAPGVRYLDLHILAHQIAIDGLLKLGILHNGTREEIYAAGTSRAFFPHGLGHHVGLEVHDVGQAELMSVRGGKAVHQQVPSLFPQNFHIPVYDAVLCHAPTDTQSSQLEEGMVVTVEPGIYFSIYALQHFYLPSPIHSRFINQKVLERYMPVGGIRIEDDILITSRGYENLTTAPKGNAMFEIIRGGISVSSTAERSITVSSKGTPELPLFRAPGCPVQNAPPAPQPIKRAATMPDQITQDRRKENDGRNHAMSVRRSMTTDERVQHWQQSCRQSELQQSNSSYEKVTTMCGTDSGRVKHIYVGEGGYRSPQAQELAVCVDCAILAQTLGRLRKSLAVSKQTCTKQIHDTHVSIGPVCNLPNPHSTAVQSSTKNENLAAVQETKRICAEVIRQRSYAHSVAAKSGEGSNRQTTATLPAPHPPGKMPSTQPRGQIVFDDAFTGPQAFFEHALVKESAKYHRTSSQSTSEPAGCQISSHAIASENSTPRALRSRTSMSIRTQRSQQQEQRRPSNQIDDRDWMA